MKYRHFLLPLFLLPSAYFASYHLVIARSVECYTQYGPCPDIWMEKLTPLRQYPLLKPLPKSQVAQLLGDLTTIRSFALYRRLPSTLVVSIHVKKPIGLVLSPSVLGAQFPIVDEDGTVVSHTSSSGLPQLEVDAVIPQRLSTAQTSALKVLGVISSLYNSPPRGRLDRHTLTVTPNSGPQILIDIRRSQLSWYPSLQLILTRSKISSKSPKIIDLRFKNAILTY